MEKFKLAIGGSGNIMTPIFYVTFQKNNKWCFPLVLASTLAAEIESLNDVKVIQDIPEIKCILVDGEIFFRDGFTWIRINGKEIKTDIEEIALNDYYDKIRM